MRLVTSGLLESTVNRTQGDSIVHKEGKNLGIGLARLDIFSDYQSPLAKSFIQLYKYSIAQAQAPFRGILQPAVTI